MELHVDNLYELHSLLHDIRCAYASDKGQRRKMMRLIERASASSLLPQDMIVVNMLDSTKEISDYEWRKAREQFVKRFERCMDEYAHEANKHNVACYSLVSKKDRALSVRAIFNVDGTNRELINSITTAIDMCCSAATGRNCI